VSKKFRVTIEECLRLVGFRVFVYHVQGHVYDGVLHSISRDGIYLMNATMMEPTVAEKSSLSTEYAVGDSADSRDIAQAYSPLFFLPFGMLAGLALARPYGYPYGYGYGYPGPWI